jgi:hypothetical protein
MLKSLASSQLRFSFEAKDFSKKQKKTRQNFVKTESLGPRKTFLNTVNFC